MVVRAREVLISRLLIRCRHQPLSKECRHHCSLTAPSHGATFSLHWITGGHARQEAYIWGHMKARGTYSPGPKGPQCVGGRGQRGTDIPISGAGSDAAGDANDVPPPLLLLNQLPECQVLGKGHTFRIWAQNGNCQRSRKDQARKEEQSTKLQNRSLE